MELLEVIVDQTKRSIQSLRVVMADLADDWYNEYDGMPVWKHLYHTIHSLDRWYINPGDYEEPAFHTENLNDLDRDSDGFIPYAQMEIYLERVSSKVLGYLEELTPGMLTQNPPHCPYSRMQLIMAQHRHLDMHIGMLMGFLIADRGLWPEALGINDPLPGG